MRSIALAMATFLVLVAATVAPARAAGPADVEIEEAPSDEGADDIMSGPKKREPAAPEIQYGAEGFYGIVTGTYGIEDFHELTRDVEDNFKSVPCGGNANSKCSAEYDNALGFNLRIGDRWHPHLATEVEFEWLDGFDAKDPDANKGGVGEVWSFTVNQKFLLGTGKFQPFLALGLGVLGAIDAKAPVPGGAIKDRGPAQGTGFGPKFGGGFNYYFTEHFGLTTDFAYNVGTGTVDDLRFTSFSWGFIYSP